MWLSLIPGLGQIYNKQKTKGYIFLAVTVLFLAYFLGIGAGELAKLVTLGTVRGQDNSLFILIRGAFHLIITLVYFLFYALNIKDAGTVAKRINNGIAVPKLEKKWFKPSMKMASLFIDHSFIHCYDLCDHLPSFSNFDDRLYQLRLQTYCTNNLAGLDRVPKLH